MQLLSDLAKVVNTGTMSHGSRREVVLFLK
jgi:hypothetical protein